jgi:peptide/nickel transport system substrate-binding protein
MNSQRHSRRRRRLLQGVGGSAVLGLAGCSGDGGDGGGGGGDGDGGNGGNDSDGGGNASDGGDGSGGGQPMDPEFTGIVINQPEQLQYNPYNAKNYYDGRGILYDPLATYNHNTGEWIPFVAEDWTIEDQSATVSLRDTYTWTNGNAVTAEDVVRKLRLDKYIGTGLWDFTESVSAPDDGTVELSFAAKINSTLAAVQLLTLDVNAPEAEYGEYLTALEEASSEDEENSALSELTGFAPSEPVASNGPFRFKNADASGVTFERYPEYANGHITGEDINFPRYKFRFASGSQPQVLIKSGEVDGGLSTLPREVYDERPEYMKNVFEPVLNGMGIAFQYENEHLRKRRVRQAIAHLVPRKQIVENNSMGYLKTPHRYAAGLDPSVVDNWLGDFKDDLVTYAWESQNPEKATSLLEEAGYAKENGTWVDEGGSALSMDMKVRSNAAEWVTATQYIASLLSNFGIEANARPTEGTAFATQFQNGEFQSCAQWWGGWSTIGHPYNSVGGLYRQEASITGSNLPETFEVPMPVGDPEGSRETFDLMAKVEELGKTTDEERVTELARQLSWAYNWHLPRYPIQTHTQTIFYSVDEWEAPAADDPDMAGFRPMNVWVRLGGYKAKLQG